MDGNEPTRYLVIVHPAGRLDDDRLAQFWTEVPALSACTGSGETADEAIGNTRAGIREWLTWSSGAQAADAPLELVVEPAY